MEVLLSSAPAPDRPLWGCLPRAGWSCAARLVRRVAAAPLPLRGWALLSLGRGLPLDAEVSGGPEVFGFPNAPLHLLPDKGLEVGVTDKLLLKSVVGILYSVGVRV